MDRRLLLTGVGAIAIAGAAGALIATAKTQGAAFIPGDKPVTEEQVRERMLAEGYLDVKIVREGNNFEATGTKAGKTAKVLVDSRTGRLVDDDDDDDD